MIKRKNGSTDEHASFWMGSKYSTEPNTSYLREKRSSIAKFVRIICPSTSIPVRYITENSFTDGKTVYVSASVEQIDVAVGLALHEASHIAFSDFNLLKRVTDFIPRRFYDELTNREEEESVVRKVSFLLNLVEDRRVDRIIMRRFPGYQAYYRRLYEFYFDNPIIVKRLKSSMFRDETWRSYLFRIINLLSGYADLSALKGLREIHGMIFADRARELKDSHASLRLAMEVYKVVDAHASLDDERASSSDENHSEEKNQQELAEFDEKESQQELAGFDKEAQQRKVGIDGKEFSSVDEEIGEAYREQRLFLSGETEKESISPRTDCLLGSLFRDRLESCVTTHENPSEESSDPTFVMKEPSIAQLENYLAPNMGVNDLNSESIRRGICLGNRLAKKLLRQTRNTLITLPNKRNGRLFRRTLFRGGFDSERLFCQKRRVRSAGISVFISGDASGSMRGEKWKKFITVVTALSQSLSLIEKARFVVSLRVGLSGIESPLAMGADTAVALILYDSKSGRGIKSLFDILRRVAPAGHTPDGEVLNAIRVKNLIPLSTESPTLFVDISDGMPNNTEYAKKEVHQLSLNRGIRLIPFFLGETDNEEFQQYQSIYPSATFVDVGKAESIAEKMNRLFLNQI